MTLAVASRLTHFVVCKRLYIRVGGARGRRSVWAQPYGPLHVISGDVGSRTVHGDTVPAVRLSEAVLRSRSRRAG